VRVLNPVETMLVNSDKAYLRDLEALGAKTLPTRWIERGAAAAEIATVVAKPAVGRGGDQNRRCRRAPSAPSGLRRRIFLR